MAAELRIWEKEIVIALIKASLIRRERVGLNSFDPLAVGKEQSIRMPKVLFA